MVPPRIADWFATEIPNMDLPTPNGRTILRRVRHLSLLLTIPPMLLLLLEISQTSASPRTQRSVEFTGGAIGNGIADDTTAIQSVLNSGKTVVLGTGKVYRISQRLNILFDNTGIVGDGTTTLLMGSRPGEFDNASAEYATRYLENAVGIYAVGIQSPVVDRVRIRFENQIDDRYVKAIAFRNCKRIRISRNDISNFTKSNGMIYVGGSQRGSISRNHIYDGYTNSATWGQMTAIAFDDDDVGSSDIVVDSNFIHDLVVGPDFLAKFNVQTDGIDPLTRATRITVSNNFIDNVGEGIDLMGIQNVVESNIITNAKLFGIKIIHGASGNIVRNNIIIDSGIGGIVLAGTSQLANTERPTNSNEITGNTILGVNSDQQRKSRTYGIGISGNHGNEYLVTGNSIMNNSIALEGTGKIGIFVAPLSGSGNIVSGNTITGWSAKEYDVDPSVATLVVP